MTDMEKKELRRLAVLSRERELAMMLGQLEDILKMWRQGEMSASDMDERVADYHETVTRTAALYDKLPGKLSAARALAWKILERSEISSELLAALEPLSAIFVEHSESK